MKIIGAGLAGLLAATMLRRHKPVVYEAQASLPNNHDALLRFRSDAVSKATGIPFKKVRVQKAVCGDGQIFTTPNLQFSNMYAKKVTGEVIERSIMNLESVERYIAPQDFVSQIAEGLEICYDSRFRIYADEKEPTISTIPMPALMEQAGWAPPIFNYRTVTTITCDIVDPKVDVYQTLYYPGTELMYRASLTGSHMMIEFSSLPSNDGWLIQHSLRSVLSDFGIGDADVDNVDCKTQRYGKIAPIPERERKEFILAMSDKYNIYSLGRYGTWRNILLDDVVHDIQVIEQFITQRDSYGFKLAHR